MNKISRRAVLRGGAVAASAVFITRTAAPSTAWASEGASSTARAASGQPLAMAVASIDVTPHVPPAPSLWMGGYGWGKRSNATQSVARPLRAQCAVIYDNGVPNILLRVDVVSIPREVHQAIRKRVLDEGLVQESAAFLLASSHTHSGPLLGTRPDPYVLMELGPADVRAVSAYADMYVDQLVELVRRTRRAAPVGVTLGYAEGQSPLAVNRCGLPYTLPEVPVVLARSTTSGKPVAVLFGHACHNVCRGKDEVYDSDHCGYASQLIEKQLGVPALFFQGAAGDQNPDTIGGEGAVTSVGARLATSVLDVVRDNRFTPVSGPFANALTEIQLPFSVDTRDPHVRETLRQKYQWRIDNITNVPEDGPDFAARRHAEVMLRQIHDGTLPASIPMPLQRWRLGGLTILALAHEVLSGYAVGLRRQHPGPLWVMAYANEVGCYVPADETLWAGLGQNDGYEAGWNT